MDAPRGALGVIYPGTCRSGCDSSDVAIRLLTNNSEIAFDDLLQGRIAQRLESESGDFVIRRRDGLVAYHLAVVVDDEIQGVTEIMRGIDLMDSTPRQIWLQRQLDYPTPDYVHIPVAVHEDGSKLSKLTGATAIPLDDASTVLVDALRALGQQPPENLANETPASIWQWARLNWDIGVLRNQATVMSEYKAMAEDENPLR